MGGLQVAGGASKITRLGKRQDDKGGPQMHGANKIEDDKRGPQMPHTDGVRDRIIPFPFVPSSKQITRQLHPSNQTPS